MGDGEYSVSMGTSECAITERATNKVIGTATKTGKIYQMDTIDVLETNYLSVSDKMILWHRSQGFGKKLPIELRVDRYENSSDEDDNLDEKDNSTIKPKVNE